MMKTYDYRLFMFIFAMIRSKTDMTMKRTLLSIASLALIFSVNSCSDFKFEFNEDYDLNNIKIDKFSGLQGIAAPIGSTTKFMFGEAQVKTNYDPKGGSNPEPKGYGASMAESRNAIATPAYDPWASK